MAGYHPFTIEQGTTWARKVTFGDHDITGYSVRMQLRRRVTDDTVALELTTENSKIAITNAAIGEVELRLSAAETAALSGEYVYDLEFVNGSEVFRLLEGPLSISAEVTR